MIIHHCIIKWLGAFRKQAITWANTDPDLCFYMLGHNELMLYFQSICYRIISEINKETYCSKAIICGVLSCLNDYADVITKPNIILPSSLYFIVNTRYKFTLIPPEGIRKLTINNTRANNCSPDWWSFTMNRIARSVDSIRTDLNITYRWVSARKM